MDQRTNQNRFKRKKKNPDNIPLRAISHHAMLEPENLPSFSDRLVLAKHLIPNPSRSRLLCFPVTLLPVTAPFSVLYLCVLLPGPPKKSSTTGERHSRSCWSVKVSTTEGASAITPAVTGCRAWVETSFSRISGHVNVTPEKSWRRRRTLAE